MRTTALPFVLVLALASACGEPKPDDTAPPEGDTDTDADADTDADTDADSDADTDVTTETDCGDGLDDDGDGLVDCEDGDCAGDPLCEEADCDDGLDNDADGLTDCDDDDCWGTICHPAGVRARVLGGGGLTRQWHKTSYRRPWGTAWRWDYTFTSSALATSVQGVVQVLPHGAASWAATSAHSSCAWSVAGVDIARVGQGYYRPGSEGSYSAVASVARSGFQVEPGCRVSGSWFLPGELFVWSGAAYLDYSALGWFLGGSSPWYALDKTGSSSRRSSTPWYESTLVVGSGTQSFAITSGGDEILAVP